MIKLNRLKNITILTALLFGFCWSSTSLAYQPHDITKILSFKDRDGATLMEVHYEALDAMIAALSPYADTYPPKFENDNDLIEATENIGQLMFVLKKINYGGNDMRLLRRAAYVYQMAHNMEIEGADVEAEAVFDLMLKKSPQSPDINMQYGVYLMGIARADKAEFYLSRAKTLGMFDATYTLAFAKVVLGKHAEAQQLLSEYVAARPNDINAQHMLTELKEGRLTVVEVDTP